MLQSAIFAMEHNFRATLADFGLLKFGADNLPFLGNFGANWNLEHP